MQGCSCCDGTSEAAAEVAASRPDLDMVDSELWSVGDPQEPGEDPTNAAAIFFPVASETPVEECNKDTETSEDDAC